MPRASAPFRGTRPSSRGCDAPRPPPPHARRRGLASVSRAAPMTSRSPWLPMITLTSGVAGEGIERAELNVFGEWIARAAKRSRAGAPAFGGQWVHPVGGGIRGKSRSPPPPRDQTSRQAHSGLGAHWWADPHPGPPLKCTNWSPPNSLRKKKGMMKNGRPIMPRSLNQGERMLRLT